MVFFGRWETKGCRRRDAIDEPPTRRVTLTMTLTLTLTLTLMSRLTTPGHRWDFGR